MEEGEYILDGNLSKGIGRSRVTRTCFVAMLSNRNTAPALKIFRLAQNYGNTLRKMAPVIIKTDLKV